MWRNMLRVAATLAVLHGVLTFVVAFTVFPGKRVDVMAFAQHGFTFVFLACLNVATWQAPRRPRTLGYVVHACNVAFLGFNLAFGVVNPEPPTIVAAVVLLLLTVAAVGVDTTLRRNEIRLASMGVAAA
jgi:hypothetical protein